MKKLMTEGTFNLLREPLITVDDENGEWQPLTLPGILARLSRRLPTEFPRLQAHQFQPWHAFLVQLGAIAMDGHGESDLPEDDDTWLVWLQDLSLGLEEAWSLVVQDLSRPAFMQPPVPEGALAGWNGPITEPDDSDLDLLVTAKAHDIKPGRMLNPRPEHWVFSLVTLQTMQGYSGKANYGIARMNGGYGSRPSLGFARSDRLSDRFAREVGVWLGQKEHILRNYPLSEFGLSLLWLEPWDGSKSLPLSELHPFFIEISRRVRLRAEGRSVSASRRTTAAPRIDAETLKGDTGDIWTPVQPTEKGTKAFSSSQEGFSYRVLQALLFGGDWRQPAALSLSSGETQAPVFAGRTLSRGQGQTQGFHERVLPVPARVARMLGARESRDIIGTLSRERVANVDELRKRVLRPALIRLLQGGPDKPKNDDDRIDAWSALLDAHVDSIFFPRLFDAVEDPAGRRVAWQQETLDIASGILRTAMASLPIPSARRYRAIAAAEAAFWKGARNWAPDLFEKGEANGTSDAIQAAS